MVQRVENLRRSGAPDFRSELVNAFNDRNKVSGMGYAKYPLSIEQPEARSTPCFM